MFQGDLANPGVGSREKTWIRLPKNMKHHIFISGVGRVGMGIPIRGVAVKFDITGVNLAIGS